MYVYTSFFCSLVCPRFISIARVCANKSFFDIGIELAKLHSTAVDYPKSGLEAVMPRRLKVRKYPHFMQKDPEKSYHSKKILGVLYDKVRKVDFKPVYGKEFDPRILRYQVSKKLLKLARFMKSDYDMNMRRIMAQYDISTEFEVYSTFVLEFTSEKNHYKFHEEIIRAIEALSERFKRAVYDKLKTKDEYTVGIFAAAAYKLTHMEVCQAIDKRDRQEKIQRDSNGKKKTPSPMPFISYPWLFKDLLGKLASCQKPFDQISVEVELDISTWSVDGKEDIAVDCAHISLDDLDQNQDSDVNSDNEGSSGPGSSWDEITQSDHHDEDDNGRRKLQLRVKEDVEREDVEEENVKEGDVEEEDVEKENVKEDDSEEEGAEEEGAEEEDATVIYIGKDAMLEEEDVNG